MNNTAALRRPFIPNVCSDVLTRFTTLARWLAAVLFIAIGLSVRAGDVIWFDDALPNGAGGLGTEGDTWNWITANPTPVSGTKAHESAAASGIHRHWYGWGDNLQIPTGVNLFVWVYLDPAAMPREIMLQLSTSSSWEHRIYWGENLIPWGTDGTVSRHYGGALPAGGGWTKLVFPASAVGMENDPATGAAFIAYDGRVVWDAIGTTTTGGGGTVGPGAGDTVWFSEALPNGAGGQGTEGDTWNWVTSPAGITGSLSHESALNSGVHRHWYGWGDNLQIVTGDKLFVYVYLDPANPPREIMLQLSTSTSWEHRVYWGENLIPWGTDGTVSRYYGGPLPTAGGWARLEVPASAVGMENDPATGAAFVAYDGHLYWDAIGKFAAGTPNPAAAPTFNPAPNTYSSAQSVTLASATSNATIYYTLDGSQPSTASTQFSPSTPINVASTTTIKAIATAPGYSTSPTASGTYTINTTGDGPVADLPAGAYSMIQLVRLSTSLSGATIYYTTDGTNPSATNGQPYSSPIGIGNGTTMIKAIAIAGAQSTSVTTLQYQIPGAPGTDVDYTALKVPDVGTEVARLITPQLLEVKLINALDANQIQAAIDNPNAPLIQPSQWGSWFTDQPNGSGGYTESFAKPATSVFQVTVNGTPVTNFTVLGAKRRPLYAAFSKRDLRIENSLYLQLPSAVAASDTVQVTDTTGSGGALNAPLDPYRYSPAIHVNQEGYAATLSLEPSGTNAPKRARVGYYLGSGGQTGNGEELDVSQFNAFYIVKLQGTQRTKVYPASAPSKAMDLRSELGYDNPHNTYGTQPPYQSVYEANFDDLTDPGTYQVVVPGLGASLPFRIDDGVLMQFKRTYALGIYGQRCGVSNDLPYTRFTHGICHDTPAQIPWPVTSANADFTNAWNLLESLTAPRPYKSDEQWNSPVQSAPQFTRSNHYTNYPTLPITHTIYDDHPELRNDSLAGYKSNSPGDTNPDVNVENFSVGANGVPQLNTIGGHHDAGDYSKYMVNSASLVHYLVFTADYVPGGNASNLGIPESDGSVPDVLREAKLEADFISRLQDPTDGGFFDLVYPRVGATEMGPPDHAQNRGQIVWPKNSVATASAVAALAECASSKAFVDAFGADVQKKYIRQAKAGWIFLKNLFAAHGGNIQNPASCAAAYQKLYFYGDFWAHNDEVAWAAAELYLLTGDPEYRDALLAWFPNPSDLNTYRYGNIRMSEQWGNAVRSFAFASHAMSAAQPYRHVAQIASDFASTYVTKFTDEVIAAADDMVTFTIGAYRHPYGSSVSRTVKNQINTGWFFSTHNAMDVAVGYLLLNPTDTTKRRDYLETLLDNLNYEAGCNPVNVSFVTGLGQRRQRETIDQYGEVDRRVLPRTGIPLGNLGASYEYYAWAYGSTLHRLTFPYDYTSRPYAFYDRWTDTFNTQNEFVTPVQARALLALTLLASGTSANADARDFPHDSLTVTPVAATSTTPARLTASGSVTAGGATLDLSQARVVWELENAGASFGTSVDLVGAAATSTWYEIEATWPNGKRINATGSLTPVALAPTLWSDDAIGGSWYGNDGEAEAWVTSNPGPYSGGRSFKSANASGKLGHSFHDATYVVNPTDTLFAYVYLDASAPPTEILMAWQYRDASQNWVSSQKYWTNNASSSMPELLDAGRNVKGALPPAGKWTRIEVKASDIGITSPQTIENVYFYHYNGTLCWDAVGKY